MFFSSVFVDVVVVALRFRVENLFLGNIFVEAFFGLTRILECRIFVPQRFSLSSTFKPHANEPTYDYIPRPFATEEMRRAHTRSRIVNEENDE